MNTTVNESSEDAQETVIPCDQPIIFHGSLSDDELIEWLCSVISDMERASMSEATLNRQMCNIGGIKEDLGKTRERLSKSIRQLDCTRSIKEPADFAWRDGSSSKKSAEHEGKETHEGAKWAETDQSRRVTNNDTGRDSVSNPLMRDTASKYRNEFFHAGEPLAMFERHNILVTGAPDEEIAINCNEILTIAKSGCGVKITFNNGMQEFVAIDYQTAVNAVWGETKKTEIGISTEGVTGQQQSNPANNRTCEGCNSLLKKALSFAQELQELHQSRSEAVNKLLAQMGSKQEGC